jgi:hypothetical protein
MNYVHTHYIVLQQLAVSLLTSLTFLLGGMGAWKFKKIINFASYYGNNSETQTEVDRVGYMLRCCMKLSKYARWETYQRKFMVMYYWEFDCKYVGITVYIWHSPINATYQLFHITPNTYMNETEYIKLEGNIVNADDHSLIIYIYPAWKCLLVSMRADMDVTLMNCLQKFGWEVLHHTPCSPNLVPSDYHLFGPSIKRLAGLQSKPDFVMEATRA